MQLKLSKTYRKLKLLRNGSGYTSPESGHYEVERTSIMLPITLAENYNDHWRESGVYYEELPEEEITESEVVETKIETTPRKPTSQEIRAKAKELGMAITIKTTNQEMLDYIQKNI